MGFKLIKYSNVTGALVYSILKWKEAIREKHARNNVKNSIGIRENN